MIRAGAGAVWSKCLRRGRQTNIIINCQGVWKNLNHLPNRNHCFFGTYNSISRVEQPTVIKSLVSDLSPTEEECSSDSGDECSSESGDECSSEYSSESGEECSLSDECPSAKKPWYQGEYFSSKEFPTRDECSLFVEWSWGQEPWYASLNALVAPLLQVFSVSLYTNFDDSDSRPCQIYGSVISTNANGHISCLYNRYLANPQTIPNGRMLSLLGVGGQELDEDFITYGTTSNTTIDFDLKDMSRNTVVIKHKYNLHSITDEFQHSSDKLIKDIVYGENGFALLYYSKFLYANNVVVKLAIFSKRNTCDPFVNVYGNIVAGYGNARQYCNSDDDVRHMKCTLFSKPFDRPQRVRHGKIMRLSRYLVAVPANSSLIIDADISDSHGPLVGGSVEFPLPGLRKKLIDDEFGTIVVYVYLGRDLGFFPKVNIKDEDVHLLTEDSLVGAGDGTANIKNTSIPRSRAPSDILVEVFSAYVVGTNHEVSAVSGTISVDDNSAPIWNMYDRGIENPEFIPSQRKGIITLDGLFSIANWYLCCINFYLHDPINNKDLCNTLLFYDYRDLDAYVYDTRVCSYFKGAHGHVVLHHIIFSEACQANLEISFLPDYPSSLPVNVCGSVIASYSNYNYSTDYEKKFFRSELFYKPETELVQLDRNFSVPLSKFVVAVPKGAALVVEVDLQAMSSSNHKEIVFGKRKLKINMFKTVREEILCKYYRVQISATFKRVRYNPTWEGWDD